MSFANPAFLWIVFAIPLGFILERKAALAVAAAAGSLAGRGGALRASANVLALLDAAALLFMALALSGPIGGEIAYRRVSSGAETAILLDVSLSMMALDGSPDGGDSRSAAALDFAGALARSLGDPVLGLAVFRGDGACLLPATEGVEAFEDVLPYARAESVALGGTDYGEGIAAALECFGDDPLPAKIIVLLGDGEDRGSGLDRAIAKAKEAGALILAIGFGEDEASTLPGEGGRSIASASGPPIMTSRDMGLLRELSQATGGYAMPSQEGSSLGTVISTIESASRAGSRTQFAPLDLSPLASGLAVLAMVLRRAAGRYVAGRGLESGKGRA